MASRSTAPRSRDGRSTATSAGSRSKASRRATLLLSLVFATAFGCANVIGLSDYEKVDDEEGGGMCTSQGVECDASSECCEEALCISFQGADAVCADSCNENAGCRSACCALLSDSDGEFTGGACAGLEVCGGAGCREDGFSCDVNGDCCGFEFYEAFCVNVTDGNGPGACLEACFDDSDCDSNCCVPLDDGLNAVCAPESVCAG